MAFSKLADAVVASAALELEVMVKILTANTAIPSPALIAAEA